jgi:hypothetical protein
MGIFREPFLVEEILLLGEIFGIALRMAWTVLAG